MPGGDDEGQVGEQVHDDADQRGQGGALEEGGDQHSGEEREEEQECEQHAEGQA